MVVPETFPFATDCTTESCLGDVKYTLTNIPELIRTCRRRAAAERNKNTSDVASDNEADPMTSGAELVSLWTE